MIWRLRFVAAAILVSLGIGMAGDIHLRWKSFSTPPFPTPVITTEQYGIGTNAAGNTNLPWKTYMHTDQPRDMVILVHGGGFRAGDYVQQAVALDLYYQGFNV